MSLKGFSQEPQTFTYNWADSTITMQKYFLVMLKKGPVRSQDSVTAAQIQAAHLEYLGKMYVDGHSSLTGPSEGNDEILGFVVYNTATAEEARQLAEGDPAVKSGRLIVDVIPWWVAKGLRLK